MSGPHEILVIEDDPIHASALEARFRAKGWVPTVVDNAADAAKLVAERDFCGASVDLRLPAHRGELAVVESGFTLIRDVLRVRFGRFDEKTGKYFVPLVVVSNETAPETISTALEIGGDAFVDKAGLEDPAYVTNKLEERLRIAGRADHAACGRLIVPPPGGRKVKMCTIAIDGRMRGARTIVHINGEEGLLSPRKFLPFLRLSAMSMKNPEAWEHRSLLGLGAGRSAAHRLREPFEGLVPDDFEVLEWGRNEYFRWNPLIHVDRIDWEVLAVHSDAPVRKLAAEHLR
jgi:DNA-binding response OmpR family regulator